MTDNSPKNVNEILEFYSDEVISALATALTVDDSFPVEVLNEIRNSYTHLARASRLGETHQDFSDEIDGAYRHLKRTCIDCMKVCVFTLAANSEKVITALEEDLQLPDGVHKKMSELRKRRKSLSAYEGQEPTHDAIQEYKVLFDLYDKFYQELDEQFAGDSVENRKQIRNRKQKKSLNKSLLLGFILGLSASLIVALIFAYGQNSWPF